MPGFLLHVGATVLCAHGGQATVTSALGKGSTFYFTLPLNGAS